LQDNNKSREVVNIRKYFFTTPTTIHNVIPGTEKFNFKASCHIIKDILKWQEGSSKDLSPIDRPYPHLIEEGAA